MEKSKFFMKSTTVIGFIIAAIGFLAPLFGFELGATDSQQVETALTILAGSIDQIMQAGGTLVMLWGRWRANQPLTIKAGA